MSISTHDSRAHNSSNAAKVLQTPMQNSNKQKKETLVKTENLRTTTNDAKNAPQTNKLLPAAQGRAKKEESLIKPINTREEYDKLIESIKDKYILVWFSATWCRPCKELAMKFQEIAQKYHNKIVVLKIDVDEMQDLALDNEVSVMPAYMMVRNGQKMAHYVGSKEEHINELVEKYLEEKSS